RSEVEPTNPEEMENGESNATFCILHAPFSTLPFGSPLNTADLSPLNVADLSLLTRIIHERRDAELSRIGS
ncbi:MAG: hypothetical protein KAV82_05330, partial [Phycisphaerae bacterium]|nr:hypothetical protein [Phycisphaerae bacterium]